MHSTSNGLGAALFGAPSTPARETGLTLLRIAVGVIFMAHGAQKFFMLGIPVVAQGFAQGGIPMASFMAPFIASVELLGGTALVLGLLTRLAALGTAFTMLGAMLLVHLKGGFFLPSGIEYTVVLLSASVALILMGPGSFSLDALLARRALPRRVTARRAADRRAA
jgi:putative oxidoreductase